MEPKSNMQKISSSGAATLLDVLQKLSLAKDLETIMFIVRKAARKLSDSDGATFVLKDGNMCFYAAEDAIAPLWQGKRFPLSICVSGWVMQNRQAVIIEDIYNDERVPIDAYRPTFVKSLAMVPIRTVDPIGAIGTYWAEKYKPTEEQFNLLKALADSTSVAMENIRLHSRIEVGHKETSAQLEMTQKLIATNHELESSLAKLNHRNKEMQWLKELSSKLQTCNFLEEAYVVISQYVNQLLPNAAGSLYIMHPSRNYLESVCTWNELINRENIIKPDDCLALRQGSPYHVTHANQELVCAHIVQKGSQAYSCLPLYAQSDIIGLFYLEWKNTESVSEQKKEEKDILSSTIAEQIALGISNIKLRETLRNQSVRDVLTGLYNRRYIEETLERELSRCIRDSEPLAIFMLDIDHFKQFNDQFGHEAGDIVIQSLANVLQSFIRKGDIACRYGGEEFLLVMPGVNRTNALNRSIQLHEAITHIHVQYGGQMLKKITVSMGLAMYPEHANNTRDLISKADMALYEAKNSGRNKTVEAKN